MSQRIRPKTLWPLPVGSARWKASLVAICDPLVSWLAAGVPPWPALFTAPWPVTRRQAMRSWVTYLVTAQNHQCFWCGGTLSASDTTIEHVIPYESALWPRLSRPEQLLTLRVSHPLCNIQYARWRAETPAHRVAAMDRRVVRLVRQTLRQYPIFAILGYRQYQPAPVMREATDR